MKIGYFADGPWAQKCFDKIVKDASLELSFICTRYNKPDKTLMKKAAIAKIDVINHININSEDFKKTLKTYDCDIFVSMSFDQIFKKSLINLPPLKIINCHSGKLPFYRGRNVLNWALINDEKEFGITIHYIDEGIDTGDIILQTCLPITDKDSYATLLKKAYFGCSENLYKAIKIIQSGQTKTMKQNDIDPFGFYCSARKEGDEIISWSQNSRDIFNFVRAINKPGPGATTFFGLNEIKINEVEVLPKARDFKGIEGCVIGVNKKFFIVKTKDSFLKVVKWSSHYTPKIGDRLK